MDVALFQVGHFLDNLTAPQAMELFRQSVKNVNIAISSYCNRKCPYCPNSISGRLQQNYMSDGLFFNVMSQLETINYSGSIRLHRYNEPLADREYALSRIRSAIAMLPNCKIQVFTNGDYLTKDYVDELVCSGISQIIATAHTTDDVDAPEARTIRLEKHLQRIGYPYGYVFSNDDAGTRVARIDCGNNVVFTFSVNDFNARDGNGKLMMSDRGESLQVNRNYVRLKPCWTPFTELEIEWDGRLLPCCEIQPDVFSQDAFVLGRLDDASNIFMEWCKSSYVSWRKSVFHYGPKSKPCRSCTLGELVEDVAGVRDMVEQWRRVLNLDN